MKTLFLFLVPSLGFACFDPRNKPLDKPYEALRGFESGNRSFGACLDKLEKIGVDLHRVAAWRRERADGDNGPVIYTILIQGADSQDQQTRLAISYDLSKHAFTCPEPSHLIPKCL